MECKLCDYYRNENSGKCLFTGVYFSTDVENLNSEYPCSDFTFEDYLRKPSLKSDKSLCLTGSDWRYNYRRCHIAISTRYKKRAL